MAITPIAKKDATAPNSAVDFATRAGSIPRTVKAPVVRLRKLSDPASMGVNMMIFGPTGSGKTYAMLGLLELGYKLFILDTDIGGTGLSTLRMTLLKMGRADLLDNVNYISVNDYETSVKFLKNPELVIPEIYQLGIDVLVWEGYSTWQQVDVSEFIGAMTPVRTGNKVVSDARASGLQLEQQEWGQIRNASVRGLSHFCALHNKETGQIWHKVVTSHEKMVSKGQDAGGGFRENKEPLLSGQAGIIIQGAFDLIIKAHARKTDDKTDETSQGRAFDYITAGHGNLVAKRRAWEFPAVIENVNPKAFWADVFGQAGLGKGATSPELVRPIAEAVEKEVVTDEAVAS